MPIFGQLVIGPPGSGKSTYCHGMKQYLEGIGRKVSIVNLDPGNENLPFQADLDVRNLITVEDVMEEMNLGPNGGLLYCMEYIERNLDWLMTGVAKLPHKYVIFDLPGQVELFTHHDSVKKIVEALCKKNVRLCTVNLVDSHYCSDAGKFISVLLVSLTTMLQIGLPHVNVLSKVDLAEKYGKLDFGLDFYMDVLDLGYLLETIPDDPFTRKYAKLNQALVDIVTDYSLVTFHALDIEKKKFMEGLRKAVDKANGYVFGVDERGLDIMAAMSCATGAEFEDERVGVAREMFSSDD